MENFRRRNLNDRCYLLDVFECPRDIIGFAAQLGSGNVTIENFLHYGRQRAGFQFQVHYQGAIVTPTLKQFNVDFAISKQEFIQYLDVWEEQGCYAIFHALAPLKLKATDLPENKRYWALENFGWTLEIAIPGSASDGWGRFASPVKMVIDKIEEKLQQLKT